MLSQDVELLHYSHAPGQVYGHARTVAVPKPARPAFSAAALHSDLVYMAAVMLGLLGFFYLFNGFIAQQGYEMQELRSEIIKLEKSNETMRLEVARLESPARIQEIAETTLGMHVPQYAIYGSGDADVDQGKIRD